LAKFYLETRSREAVCNTHFSGAAEDLPHALVTEYSPGAAIGISLLSRCIFRFRRKAGTTGSDWEHSIPAVDALRDSITFRSLQPKR